MDVISTLINTLITTFVTALTEVIMSDRAKKYRELTVEVQTVRSLDNIINNDFLDVFKDSVSLHYAEQDISKASVAKFSIINTGKASIKRDDFETRPKFVFGKNARLIKAKMVEVLPEALEGSITLEMVNHHLTIEPLLLNRNEYITIAVLGTDIEFVKPVFRLIGMSEIKAGGDQRLLKSIIRSDRDLARYSLISSIIIMLFFALTVLFLMWLFAFALSR